MIDYGVQYRTDRKTDELTLFSDADYAADKETRCSTTGYVSTFVGGLISWKSHLQKTVALSTMEAEYMALSSAVQEAIWLRRLLSEFGKIDLQRRTAMKCNNQSAICFTKDPVQHQRSKHIDVRYHFARQAHQEKTIAVEYVPTEEILADALTKSLTKDKMKLLVKFLGHERKETK